MGPSPDGPDRANMPEDSLRRRGIPLGRVAVIF